MNIQSTAMYIGCTCPVGLENATRRIYWIIHAHRTGMRHALRDGMSNRTQSAEPSGSYARLLASGGFQAFLWTQFLGAFNDNVYKMIVSIMALRLAADSQAGGRYLALAGAVFVIPFLLFAGPAGQLADRFSKTRVLQSTKALEIVIMLTGIVALLSHRIDL